MAQISFGTRNASYLNKRLFSQQELLQLREAEIEKWKQHVATVVNKFGSFVKQNYQFKRDLKVQSAEVEFFKANSIDFSKQIEDLRKEIEHLQINTKKQNRDLQVVNANLINALDEIQDRIQTEKQLKRKIRLYKLCFLTSIIVVITLSLRSFLA